MTIFCALQRVLFILFFAGFLYTAASLANPVPIPPGEQNLLTEEAQKWADASPQNDILEGALFDANGNLLFCNVSKRKIMLLTPDMELSTLVELQELGAGGLAFHPDGRLFMAALDLRKGAGAILAWSPVTGLIETIVPAEAGYWPNDLVFGPEGGFYFSDFKGSASDPAGGIYYVSPDFKKITPVIANLSQANGVALSPDGKTLWATEFAKNRLHRASLIDPVTIAPTGSTVPWHFAGPAPDSMRVDTNGNVYVAIYGQGRTLVFNGNGIPIGQILLPDRETGKNLLSTSLALNPECPEAFLVTSSEESSENARIFRASSLAKGLPPVTETN